MATSDCRPESLAFSPDGKLLATGNHDRSIRFWDVATGRAVRRIKGHEDWVVSVAFSPDGRTLASGGKDSTVCLWEVATGKERLRLTQEFGWIRGLSFSGDGHILFSAGTDSVIRLWDMMEGRVRGTLKGHEGGILAIALSPDGRKLLSASEDTTALVWDVSLLNQAQAGQLAELQPEELSSLWSDLAGADAGRAYRAMKSLMSSPAAAVRFLQPRLRPVSAVPDKQLAQFIADLDSNNFDQRQKAEQALQKLGELTGPALEQALKKGSSLEVRRRIEGLLDRLWQDPSGERLRELRSVEVLEYLGTAEAREILRGLAKGAAAARLTREAKASLERYKANRQR
jgi:hypothetical protein